MVTRFSVVRDLYAYERIEWRNLAHLAVGGRIPFGIRPCDMAERRDISAVRSATRRQEIPRHVSILVRLTGSK